MTRKEMYAGMVKTLNDLSATVSQPGAMIEFPGLPLVLNIVTDGKVLTGCRDGGGVFDEENTWRLWMRCHWHLLYGTEEGREQARVTAVLRTLDLPQRRR